MPLEQRHCGPRRKPDQHLVELPSGIRIALKRIVADLRDIPRDCIIDRAELLHWLRRMANRVEGVERSKVPLNFAPWNAPQARPAPLRAASPLDTAEALFRSASKPTAKKPAMRTVISRRGKPVVVESRQLMLFGGSS